MLDVTAGVLVNTIYIVWGFVGKFYIWWNFNILK